jgi:hypothetical protein
MFICVALCSIPYALALSCPLLLFITLYYIMCFLVRRTYKSPQCSMRKTYHNVYEKSNYNFINFDTNA